MKWFAFWTHWLGLSRLCVYFLMSQGNVPQTGRSYQRSQPITARRGVTGRYKGCCCNSQTIPFNTTTNKHGRRTRAVLTLRTTMARSCDDMNPYLSLMNTRSLLVFDEEYQNTWGPLWRLKMAPTVGSQGGLTGTVMARMRPGGLALLPWTKQMFAVLWGQLRLLLRVIYYTVMSGKNHISNLYVNPFTQPNGHMQCFGVHIFDGIICSPKKSDYQRNFQMLIMCCGPHWYNVPESFQRRW